MAGSGRGFASIESLQAAAEGFLAQGRLRDAELSFRELAGQTQIIDYQYDDWLRRLADIYGQLNRMEEAGWIYLYLHYFDKAQEAFMGEAGRVARARVAEVEKTWEVAAGLYEEVEMRVHAAVARERAQDYALAGVLWESLLRDSRLKDNPYEEALAYFNYGTALLATDEKSTTGKRALVDCQRILEQVADDFESAGQRARAFDCYQILVKLGKDSGQYENLAEGYLNSIRVLKDDGLKFYVLQYYEDFIALSLERGELHAASTLYQEAADFSSKSGLPYSKDYQAKAATAWTRCADRYLEEEAPIELAENAYLAAISCYSSVGDYKNVRALFVNLSTIDLSEKKCDRYRKIAGQYENAAIAVGEAPGFPDYLKQQHAYADIWFADLLEWELGGNAKQVAMSVIGDLRYPDSIRRKALVLVLTLGDAEVRGAQGSPETLIIVAEQLGELQSYSALRPLEELFEHDDPGVRRSAVRALRFLFFKRSFGLIRKALIDSDENVRMSAVEALRGLHFPHAFNPLVGIYRESEVSTVRAVALESIGKIQSIEAGEYLLSVLRQEEGELRSAAARALRALDNADLLPILRQYFQFETNPEVRAILESLQNEMRG